MYEKPEPGIMGHGCWSVLPYFRIGLSFPLSCKTFPFLSIWNLGRTKFVIMKQSKANINCSQRLQPFLTLKLRHRKGQLVYRYQMISIYTGIGETVFKLSAYCRISCSLIVSILCKSHVDRFHSALFEIGFFLKKF